MPIISPPPPPTVSIVRRFDWQNESPTAQGPDGRSLRNQMEAAFRHLWETGAADTKSCAAEITEREHIPLKPAGTVRVRFRAPKQLSPSMIERFGFDE